MGLAPTASVEHRLWGGRSLAATLGPETAATVFRSNAASTLSKNLDALKDTPLWSHFSAMPSTLLPQLRALSAAAIPVTDRFHELLQNSITVDAMFPALGMPEDLQGLTLKEFLHKAAGSVAAPGQKLVDMASPETAENMRLVADATGTEPVDWTQRFNHLAFEADAVVNRVMSSIETLARLLAPGSILLPER